ncbi:MAG: pantetheine-phosphate adenylyltransferase [Firmicutes bacterium]|nr:pantetheine-phosphate adenylyltransferase [Bacillota bacterium]
MKKVLFAGSFDPITCGHLDLINRASLLCETIVVGVVENKSKVPYFTVEERMNMIREATAHLDNVEIDCFSGLLADYVNANGIQAVVRGLRATTDFEYEIQMAQMNDRLYKDGIETIFLMTTPDHSFISSSMIKEVFLLGGTVEGLVPENVLQYMKEKREQKGGK